jgi:diadenosine tetraphosphate (Ap4A) HIT family hydrolase
MTVTVFDKIVRKENTARVVWESDQHLAFLTPFPNTPGVTIVIPKENPGDDAFDMPDDAYSQLLLAAKQVAKKLRAALDVKRVALAIEGTGVAYAHIKLYPLYGPLASQTGIEGDHTEFVNDYRGYFTTLDGPPMDDAQLDAIAAKIKTA